jgi:hypothetical protein
MPTKKKIPTLSDADKRLLKSYRQFMCFADGEGMNGFRMLEKQLAKLTSKGCNLEVLLPEAMLYASGHAGENLRRQGRQADRPAAEKRVKRAFESIVELKTATEALARQLETTRAQAPHLGLLAAGVGWHLAIAQDWLDGLQRVNEALGAYVLRALGQDSPAESRPDKRENLLTLVNHVQEHGVKQWRKPIACLVSCWEPADVRLEAAEGSVKDVLKSSGEPLCRRAEEIAKEYERAVKARKPDEPRSKNL